MRFGGRRRPLTLLVGPGGEKWLSALLEQAYPRAFPHGFRLLVKTLTPGREGRLGPVRLRIARTEHSQPNFAVRIEEGDRSVCFSGDGAPTVAAGRLYRGADVLVHECFAAQRPVLGHAAAAALLPWAEELQLGVLYLVHLGTPYRRAIMARARAFHGALRVRIARPGQTVHVGGR